MTQEVAKINSINTKISEIQGSLSDIDSDMTSINGEISKINSLSERIGDIERNIDVIEESLSVTDNISDRIVITDENMFSRLQANTCYEISKNFVLNGTYNIPEGVSFFFAGGSISGGNFNANDPTTDTYYKDKKKRPYVFGDVKFNISNNSMVWQGGFRNDNLLIDWFGTSIDMDNNSNADIINSVIQQCHDNNIVFSRMLPIDKSIEITNGVSVNLCGSTPFQGGYGTYTSSCNAGVYITKRLFSAIKQTGGRLNLRSFTCLGAKSAFTGANPRYDGSYWDNTLKDPYGVSYTLSSGADGSELANSANFCGLDLRHGSCELIDDCCFNGFCRGISFDATKSWNSVTPGWVNRTFISGCKYGLYAVLASDFFCTSCKFNSCLSDTAMDNSTNGVSRNDIKSQSKVGAAVYLSGSAMIQFSGCRWEFNYIGVYIDSSDYNVCITDSIFDRHTHSLLCVNNSNDNNTFSKVSDTFPDRRNPAISLNFTGNNIIRGLGRRMNWSSSSYSFTPGCAYFAFKSVVDTTTDSQIKTADGLRHCYVNISSNTFADEQELRPEGGNYDKTKYEYQHGIFFFNCKDNGGIHITHSSNDYNASKATNFCESYGASGTNGYAIVEGNGNTYPSGMVFATPYYHANDVAKNANAVRIYDPTSCGVRGMQIVNSAPSTQIDGMLYLVTE